MSRAVDKRRYRKTNCARVCRGVKPTQYYQVMSTLNTHTPPQPPPDDGFIDKALIVVSTAEITSQHDGLPCSCVYIHVDVCLLGYFCLCICVIVCLPVYSCVCVGACVGACQSAGLSGNSRHPSTPADGRQQSSAPRGGQSNIHHDVSLQ